MGELSFDEAYSLFAEIMDAGAAAGADLILIETMSDLLEAKAALLAAKERTTLPVFVTMTFGEDGRTFLGTEPATAAVTLTSLGADVVGINCSLGPKELREPLQKMIAATHLPVMIQPNAGLPRLENGQTVFDVEPEAFAACAEDFLQDGAAILGGCCGTTPDHIRALRPLLEGRVPSVRKPDGVCRLCGWQKVVELRSSTIATVGERINPTGRKGFQEALRSGNYDYAGELAIAQQEEGADFLVVNAGLPDIDEAAALPALVQASRKYPRCHWLLTAPTPSHWKRRCGCAAAAPSSIPSMAIWRAWLPCCPWPPNTAPGLLSWLWTETESPTILPVVRKPLPGLPTQQQNWESRMCLLTALLWLPP